MSTRDDLFPLRDNEVILPAKSQGESFDVLLGEQVPVNYTRKRAEGQGEGASDHVTVVAVYDPAHALDGPAAAYADSALVIKWAAARAGLPDEAYIATIGYARVYAIVDAAPNVAPLVQSLREAGFNAVSMQEQLSALPGGLRLLRTLGDCRVRPLARVRCPRRRRNQQFVREVACT
jgi:putative ABC transport system permease protein